MSGGMDMRPVMPRDALVISGFSESGWVVGDRFYAETLLITARGAWQLPRATLATLDRTFLEPLAELDEQPTLLLLGTGEHMLRPPAAFIALARSQGLAVEFMDSRAAARTYNVLVAEQRAVAALLL